LSKPAPIIQDLLEYLDPNPSREGLRDTPQRYADFIKDFFDAPELDLSVFPNEGYDEMIVQSNIAFYSVCEHHLLPFFGYGAVAYIPNKHIVGLSGLSLTLEHFGRSHLCMEMRGLKKPDTQTTTSCLKGLFKTNSSTRSEFLHIVG